MRDRLRDTSRLLIFPNTLNSTSANIGDGKTVTSRNRLEISFVTLS